jgi:hypothetical protein
MVWPTVVRLWVVLAVFLVDFLVVKGVGTILFVCYTLILSQQV